MRVRIFDKTLLEYDWGQRCLLHPLFFLVGGLLCVTILRDLNNLIDSKLTVLLRAEERKFIFLARLQHLLLFFSL
jgi:hypothetical protein